MMKENDEGNSNLLGLLRELVVGANQWIQQAKGVPSYNTI
jgi:hypothetical protein